MGYPSHPHGDFLPCYENSSVARKRASGRLEVYAPHASYKAGMTARNIETGDPRVSCPLA
jgi:hypothetical protein